MNRLFLFTFATALTLTMVGCCPDVIVPKRADVRYRGESDNVYKVSASATAKNLELAIREAELNAFDVLFFRGLPGSPQALPMISIDEQKARGDHADYFKQFNESRYRSFVTETQLLQSVDNDGCSKQVEVLVSINARSLRSDLESRKVIRKLGY